MIKKHVPVKPMMTSVKLLNLSKESPAVQKNIDLN